MDGLKAQLAETNKRLEGKADLAQLEALRAELFALKAELAKKGEVKAEPEAAKEQVHQATLVEVLPEKAAEEEAIEDEREYELAQSAWDSLLVANLATYPTETLMILFGCVLNVAIQVTYCFIIRNSLAKPVITYEKLKDLAIWRMVKGHDVANFDQLTGTTLVTRACAALGFSTTSTAQEGLYLHLKNYDPTLCLISLFFWIMIVLGDLASTFDLMRGICSLPIAHHSKIERSEDGAITFVAISSRRLFLLVVGVLVPKAAIAIAIGYLGVTYLCFIKSAADLLLNAIALQFVMNTDELLFSEIVPLRVSKVIQSVKPLSISKGIRSHPRFKKIPLRAIIFVAVGIILVVLSGFMLLADELDLNHKAKALLCGGRQDFAYTVDRSTGAVSVSDVKVSNITAVFRSYKFRTVLQRTELDPDLLEELIDPGRGVLYIDAGLGSVEELDRYTFQEASNHLPCVDLVPGEGAYTQAFIEHELPWGLKNCSQLKGTYCDYVSRSFCPASCGCDNPVSGLYDLVGCSSQCDLVEESMFKSTIQWHRNRNTCRDGSGGDGHVYERFFTEVQSLLLQQGALTTFPGEGSGFAYLSNSSMLIFGAAAAFEFFIPFQNFTLSQWARESFDRTQAQNETNACGMIAFVDKVFNLDLCDTDMQPAFQGRVGSIRAVCLETCGYCGAERTWPYKTVSYDFLHQWLGRALTTVTVMQALNTSQGEHCPLYSEYPDIKPLLPGC